MSKEVVVTVCKQRMQDDVENRSCNQPNQGEVGLHQVCAYN